MPGSVTLVERVPGREIQVERGLGSATQVGRVPDWKTQVEGGPGRERW